MVRLAKGCMERSVLGRNIVDSQGDNRVGFCPCKSIRGPFQAAAEGADPHEKEITDCEFAGGSLGWEKLDQIQKTPRKGAQSLLEGSVGKEIHGWKGEKGKLPHKRFGRRPEMDFWGGSKIRCASHWCGGAKNLGGHLRFCNYLGPIDRGGRCVSAMFGGRDDAYGGRRFCHKA